MGVPLTLPEAWPGPRYTFEEWTRQAAMREDEKAMVLYIQDNVCVDAKPGSVDDRYTVCYTFDPIQGGQ